MKAKRDLIEFIQIHHFLTNQTKIKIKCKKCLPIEGIEIPEFSQLDKNRLLKMNIESSIKAIKCLIDDYNLSHGDAKYIVAHLNKQYGKCNRCNFDNLDREYMNCTKCGALNLNWIIED